MVSGFPRYYSPNTTENSNMSPLETIDEQHIMRSLEYDTRFTSSPY